MQTGMESGMKWQQQTWYKAGGDMIARAGFSLAMCGALAGVLYLTASDGTQDLSTASLGKPPQIATVLASFETSPGLSKSQSAIDASPAAMPVAAQIPIPVQRVAEIGPIPAKRPVEPVRRTVKEPVAVASNVAHFETCLPACETRDPLIVGQSRQAAETEVSPLPTDELVQEVSFTERSPSILGRALHAPGFVYRQGRNALTTLVRAAL
jgi:hypothetical protein